MGGTLPSPTQQRGFVPDTGQTRPECSNAMCMYCRYVSLTIEAVQYYNTILCIICRDIIEIKKKTVVHTVEVYCLLQKNVE